METFARSLSSPAHRLFMATLWLLPFYLPVAVWLASSGGSIYILSAWKELAMAIMLLLLFGSLWLLAGQPRPVRILNMTIGLYVVLCALYIFRAESLFEFTAGALFSVRFLLFFIIAQVLAVSAGLKPSRILKVALFSGCILSVFALLQTTILPASLLTHVGYEPFGVETPGFPPAITTLGELDDFIRPQATLRGPNPLGAFLVLPFCYLIWRLLKEKSTWKILLPLGIISVGLFLTLSRSAWLAAGIGALTIAGIGYRERLKGIRKLHLAMAFVLLCVLVGILFTNKTVRLIIFREDKVSSENPSDDIRRSLTHEAWHDVVAHPFGRGPGNAGPVSAIDENDAGRIAENYYLQVAQEVGWVGVGLFITITALLAKQLWALRKDGFALVALAVLVGLAVANLTLHTWADEAVSIMYWSFAGAIIGSATVSTRKAKHG